MLCNVVVETTLKIRLQFHKWVFALKGAWSYGVGPIPAAGLFPTLPSQLSPQASTDPAKLSVFETDHWARALQSQPVHLTFSAVIAMAKIGPL